MFRIILISCYLHPDLADDFLPSDSQTKIFSCISYLSYVLQVPPTKFSISSPSQCLLRTIFRELLCYTVFSSLPLFPDLRSKFLFSVLFLKNFRLFSSIITLMYADYEITNCFNFQTLCILSMIFVWFLEEEQFCSPNSIEKLKFQVKTRCLLCCRNRILTDYLILWILKFL